MKRLWIAAAILAALFCATLLNSWYLRGFTRELTGLLEQAEALGGGRRLGAGGPADPLRL